MILLSLLLAVQPPVAKKIPHPQTVHGVTLQDDYYWLRNKGSKDVVAHLKAENAYTAAMMKPTAALQKTLYAEMRARVEEDAASPPVRINDWLYYHREEKGKQYPIYCRKRDGGQEVVILDVNALAKGQKFIDVDSTLPSDDGNLLAYLVDTQGFRQYTLKIRDLRTGKDLKDALERVDGFGIAPDNQTILYVTEDAETKRANKLWRHRIGDDAKNDPLVYEETDETFSLDVDRSRSGAYFFATAFSATTSEVRYLDAKTPDAAFRVVRPRQPGHEYYVEHQAASFLIRTNSCGRNFCVDQAAVGTPSEWREVTPHRPDVMIEHLLAFDGFIVRFERERGLPKIEVLDLAQKSSRTPLIEDKVYEIFPGPNPEYKQTELRFTFTSLRTPAKHVAMNLGTLAQRVLKQTLVPTYDETQYRTERLMIAAPDGVQVPVSLVYKVGTAPDGTHPLFLDGYGAYGDPFTVTFSQELVSLLDRGVVYAVAHVRGGGDLGKPWHDGGRMLNKRNTFTDFIAAAEALKKLGWAKPDALAITGMSAGGLLMGAVLNMRPDLFRAALVYVPFVDVMTTMLDDKIPLTAVEFEEWGNPRKNKAEFDYMLSYSPYDNVAAKAYPAMLVLSAYNDSQVMYWEPAKWVAKLRALKTDKQPLYLRVNMDPAGHGGVSGRYDQLKDRAFEYAFLLEQLK